MPRRNYPVLHGKLASERVYSRGATTLVAGSSSQLKHFTRMLLECTTFIFASLQTQRIEKESVVPLHTKVQADRVKQTRHLDQSGGRIIQWGRFQHCHFKPERATGLSADFSLLASKKLLSCFFFPFFFV